MECLDSKTKVADTFKAVSDYSFKLTKEVSVNDFLDKILELQGGIKEKTNFINDLIERFEALSWINDIDDESLKIVHDILAVSRELHSKFIRHFVYLNKYAIAYAKEDIKSLKLSLDDFKEAIVDMDDHYFNLPKHEEFTKANSKIQSL